MALRNKRSRRKCTCLVPAHHENGTSLPISRYGKIPPRHYISLTHPLYHQGNDYTRLQTIDDIEQLRNILVPHGIYVSSKRSYNRADTFPCEPAEDDACYPRGHLSP